MTESATPASPVAAGPDRPRDWEIPGRYVVLGLLVMGCLASWGVYTYWDLHTAPFRPLTEAIGREFQKSLPKVLGGRQKDGRWILRVAMRVPFDPEAESAEAEQIRDRLVELTRQHQSVDRYERIEFLLVQVRPEETAARRSFEYSLDEFRQLSSRTSPH